MNMTCEQCGGPIGRQSGPGGRRKFCTTCSPKRIRKPNGRPPSSPRPTPSAPAEEAVDSVYTATLVEVQALGMADHYLGALALHVARALDDSANQSGGAVAALAKCHRETIAALEAAVPKPQEESVLERLRRENRERGKSAPEQPRLGHAEG